MSVLFILAFWAFTMNITAQKLYIEKKDASVEEFEISEIDSIIFAVATEFIRVDAAPADGNWAGKYLIVYEAQAGTGANNTYQGKTVLAFNGGKDGAPVDAAGNVVVLSPTTPGDPGDLAALTGGIVDKTDSEVTITGGQIEWREDLDAAIVTIAAVDGGWSIQTAGGYYLGVGGNAGNLGANLTFNPANHVHTISIGDTDSNVTTGVIFHGCAIIQSSAGSAMRVNANTGRFGYWGIVAASGLYGQHPIALYKLKGSTELLKPSFSVDQSPKSAGWKENSTATISVKGNVAWTASVVGEGASITSGGSGTGAGIVTVSFTENTSESPRVATVTISTGDAGVATKSFNVTITQRPVSDPNLLPKRYVRMIVWAKPFDTSSPNTFSHWMLFQSVAANANDGSWYNLAKDYYAEDVIELIADLQPTCLERFITGSGNSGPGMPVPTKPGNPTMTFEQFLQKAMDAGAEGCYIIPKLDLTWLGDVKKRGEDPMNDETIFWRSARTLYNLNINPAIRTVCLDCWNDFCTNFPTDAERTTILQKLKNIGYTELQLNYTGATNTNNSLISVAKWNITTSNWTVNTTALNNFKGWPNLKEYLLYIDYPGAMDSFLTQFTLQPHTPPYGYADQQADKLISNIVNRQKELGFSYVFPFFQNGYDPKTFQTNPNGKYKGKTMYDIQKELLWYGEVQ